VLPRVGGRFVRLRSKRAEFLAVATLTSTLRGNRHVLVGQQVDVQRGAKTAGAALKFTCPEGKRLKTFGVTGHAGFLADSNYEDHKTTNVMSFPPPHTQQASGTVYAVCR
jgi:hypothetical protein